MLGRRRISESRRRIVVFVRVEFLFEVFLIDAFSSVLGRPNFGNGGEPFPFAPNGGLLYLDFASGIGYRSLGFQLGLFFFLFESMGLFKLLERKSGLALSDTSLYPR